MTRKNKLTATIIVCVSLSLAVVGVIRYISSASVGTIQDQDGLNRVKSASLTLKPQSTQFYEIRVSDELYQKSAVIDETRPIYAQYMYAGVDFGSDLQLSISLGTLSAPQLDEISYVKQRRLESGRYQIVSETPTRIIFQTTDNTEYGLFWLIGNDFAAVVGSGRSESFQKIKDTVDQTDRSWQWRK
jgi:hypothetical protein